MIICSQLIRPEYEMLFNWREIRIGKISIRFFFLQGHDRTGGEFFIVANKEA